ncbi:MAG: fumarylacetoacetate hydrolase family protein [Alphaproteobacteria bacterium]|nr:fumarylacetoacetate hydrolase family protein [Alphaproteobacteria bacterium]
MKTLRRIISNNKIETLFGKNCIYLENKNHISLSNYTFLSPVDPKVIVCVHLNYRSRLNELKRVQPEAPTYFLKPVSCLNSHLGDVVRPAGCKFLNYEGEIALVVGKKTKNIELEKAHEYILGYTIANDFGLHDFRDTDENSMVRVKGTDTLGPIGPDLVMGWDYRNKNIKTFVNNEMVQESNTNDMIWSPEYLLTDLSRSITFNKGDLILTGTPSNSRPSEPGSIVKVEVEGLGFLQNTVIEGKDTLIKNVGAEPKDSDHIRSISLGSNNSKK